MDADFALALQLQEEWNAGHEHSTKKMEIGKELNPTMSPIDPSLDYIDPTPDIYKMFVDFDKRFFWNSLGSVKVKWNSRMTRCAGQCYRSRGEISIHLSLPLLKFRPRKDLVETLLHEMIHAYLRVTKTKDGHQAHGPNFISHMVRINKCAGTEITVYHSFHAEMAANRTHWWKCNGRCDRLVKRSINRAPGPNSLWFIDHQTTCGGTFVKVKEPESYKSKSSKTLNKAKEALLNEKPRLKHLDTLSTVTAIKSPKPDISPSVKPSLKQLNSSRKELKRLSEKNPIMQVADSKKMSSRIKKEAVPFSGNGNTTGKNTALLNEKPGLKHLDTLSTVAAIKSPKPDISPSVKPSLKQLNSSRKELKRLSEKTPIMQVADSKKMSSRIKKEAVPFSGNGNTTGKNTALLNEKPGLKHLDTLSTVTAIKSPKPDISPSVKPSLKQLNSSRKELKRLSEKTPIMQVADSKKMKIGNECEKPLHENEIICLVSCPICKKSVSESGINDHLDLCCIKMN